jgi:hypothetical protein
MFSLRSFHLFFILLGIMGADLIGGWAIHEYRLTADLPTLLIGLAVILGGFGLAAYAIWFAQKTERLHIQ